MHKILCIAHSQALRSAPSRPPAASRRRESASCRGSCKASKPRFYWLRVAGVKEGVNQIATLTKECVWHFPKCECGTTQFGISLSLQVVSRYFRTGRAGPAEEGRTHLCLRHAPTGNRRRAPRPMSGNSNLPRRRSSNRASVHGSRSHELPAVPKMCQKCKSNSQKGLCAERKQSP